MSTRRGRAAASRPGARWRWALLLAALAGVLAAAGAGASSAQAAQDSQASAPGSLSLDLTRIHGTVQPEGALRLRLQVTNRSLEDRDDLRLVVTMHQRTRWRSEYHQAMDGGAVGAVVHAFTSDVGEVPARGSRTMDVEQTAETLGLARMVELGLEGVYPLRVQLLEGDEVADELVTSVVATPARPDVPLAVAPVLTLAHQPSRDAAGVFVDVDLVAGMAEDAALGTVLEALAGRGDVALTLVADALTIEEAADVASGFLVPGDTQAGAADDSPPGVRPASSPESRRARRFLSVLEDAVADPGVEIAALPYASADLVALVRGGLPSEAARHLTDGIRALEAVTGHRPTEDLLVPPDGITAEALGHALDAGARAVVLSPSEVTMPQITGPTPSSLRRLRAGPGTTVQAVVDDPWLEETLAQPSRAPALDAQHIVGELATIYFERPNRERRGIMLRLPGTRAGPVVEALGAAPFLEPVTLERFRRTVREETEPIRLDYPVEARRRELPPTYVTALRDARRSLGSLDGVLVEDRATPANFDRVLLQAASVHHRDGGQPERGRALLDAVTSTVEDLYAAVEVPETPAVTLTSLEGELPVTVRSRAEVPLRVRVHLRTGRLAVGGGPTREIVLEPDSTHVLMLPVRALSPGGTAPVDVQVTDIDGEVVVATGQVVVRSTAFSVTAVLVVGGAALFLLVWLGREAPRRYRRRATPARDPGAAPEPAGAERTSGEEAAQPPRTRSADRA